MSGCAHVQKQLWRVLHTVLRQIPKLCRTEGLCEDSRLLMELLYMTSQEVRAVRLQDPD